MNLKHFIVFFSLLISNICAAQTPNYYTLGENSLSNEDVYSILETSNGTLYVTTDDGAYRYQNNLFIPIKRNKNQSGASLFSLTENSKGEIFTANLNGQIFQIKNDSLSLIKQVPKKDLFSKVTLMASPEDDLYFSAKGTFVYNKDSSFTKIPNSGSIYFAHNDSLIIESNILNKVIISYKRKHYEKDIRELYNEIDIAGKIKLNNFGFLHYTKTNYTFPHKIESDLNNNYHTDFIGNSLYARKNKEGKINIDTLTTSNIYNKEKEINIKQKCSSFHTKDNTLYVGTYKSGIIVFPNIHNIKHINNIKPTTSIAIGENNEIYYKKIESGIFELKNKKTKKIPININIRSHQIFHNRDFKLPYYIKNDPKLLIPELFKEYNGFIKDYSLMPGSNLILGISTHLDLLRTKDQTDKNSEAICNSFIKQNNFIPYTNRQYPSKADAFSKRIGKKLFSCHFVSSDTSVYIGTIAGLLRLKNNKTTEYFYNNNSIIAIEIKQNKNNLYFTTTNAGILKKDISTKKITSLWPEKHPLTNKKITNLVIRDKKLFFVSDGSLYSYNIKDSITTRFGIESGITGYINDIEVKNKRLWYLQNSNSVNSIPLNQLNIDTTKLHINVDSISINNKAFAIKKNTKLHHSNNNITFYLSNKDFNYQKSATHFYRLVGSHSFWKKKKTDEQSIGFENLPPGNYIFEAYSSLGDIKGNVISFPFKIKLPFWRTYWFFGLIFIASTALATGIYFESIRRIKINNKKLLKQKQLESDLTDAKLKALRSQMNPHFIFNSLNSIQELILENDVEKSYDYIAEFAFLVRNILNYSNQTYISFEKELEFIKIYTKLEKLRFGDDLQIQINTSFSENIFIPSLLTQPFIENALVHGLFHKKGKKTLNVDFKLKDNVLECVVEDNGIGRKKSMQINRRRAKLFHKSFAMNAQEKRFAILKNRFGGTLGFTIIDLVDEEGSAIGTRVVIKIPFKRELNEKKNLS